MDKWSNGRPPTAGRAPPMIEPKPLKRDPDAGGKPEEKVLCDLRGRSSPRGLAYLPYNSGRCRHGSGVLDREMTRTTLWGHIACCRSIEKHEGDVR